MQALQWFQSALSRALRMPLTSSSNTHATCNHCLLRADPHKFFFPALPPIIGTLVFRHFTHIFSSLRYTWRLLLYTVVA